MPAGNLQPGDSLNPSGQAGAPVLTPTPTVQSGGVMPTMTGNDPGSGSGGFQYKSDLANANNAVNSDPNLTAPLTNAQVAQAFVDPAAAQNYAAISQGYQLPNQLGLQNYRPGGSALAGLTQLGAVSNANAANIDTGQSQALMQGQVANINALNAQARGQGPSVAELQAKQQAQQNIAGQMAMAGSQRGAANSALGLRQAGEAAAQANQQGVQAGVMGRTQEELAAQQQLTGALGGATGQVQQGAQAQAGLQQQAALQNAQAGNQATLQQGQMDVQTKLANLQAQLQAGQISVAQYNAMLQAQMAQSANDFGAQQNYGSMVAGQALQQEALQKNLTLNEQQLNLGLTSAGLGAGATALSGVLSASDTRLKTSVRPASRSIKDFLNQISANTDSHGFALMVTP